MLRILILTTRIPLPLMIKMPLIVVWAFTSAWEWANWSKVRQATVWAMATALCMVALGFTWLIGISVYMFLHPVKALSARNG